MGLRAIWAGGWVAFLMLAGCGSTYSTGLVVANGQQRQQDGNVAPVIPVQLPNGNDVLLTNLSGPSHVVAFVQGGETGPYVMSPRLTQLQNDMSASEFTIVQIVLPPINGKLATDALTQCQTPPKGMVLLVDPNRIAWQAFNQPNAEDVRFINHSGYVMATGTFQDYQSILDAATVEQQYYDRQWQEEMDGR